MPFLSDPNYDYQAYVASQPKVHAGDGWDPANFQLTPEQLAMLQKNGSLYFDNGYAISGQQGLSANAFQEGGGDNGQLQNMGMAVGRWDPREAGNHDGGTYFLGGLGPDGKYSGQAHAISQPKGDLGALLPLALAFLAPEFLPGVMGADATVGAAGLAAGAGAGGGAAAGAAAGGVSGLASGADLDAFYGGLDGGAALGGGGAAAGGAGGVTGLASGADLDLMYGGGADLLPGAGGAAGATLGGGAGAGVGAGAAGAGAGAAAGGAGAGAGAGGAAAGAAGAAPWWAQALGLGLGALAGSQTTGGGQTTKDVPEWLKPYLLGDSSHHGVLPYTNEMLDKQMQPGFLSGYDDMRTIGQGLMHTPQVGNQFNRFFANGNPAPMPTLGGGGWLSPGSDGVYSPQAAPAGGGFLGAQQPQLMAPNNRRAVRTMH